MDEEEEWHLFSRYFSGFWVGGNFHFHDFSGVKKISLPKIKSEAKIGGRVGVGVYNIIIKQLF